MKGRSPAPPYSREADESAWKNVSKTLLWSSGAIPIRLSVTEIWKYPELPKGPDCVGGRSAGPAWIKIWPRAGVNFPELESRLSTHWRILSLSTVTFLIAGETCDLI